MAAREQDSKPEGQGVDPFVHQVAIDVSCALRPLACTPKLNPPFQMSRIMNMVNPNDTLAQRVVEIARHNRSGDAFCRGECSVALPPLTVAVATFGKFPEDAMLSLHSRILAHESLASKMNAAGVKVEGMDHGDSDVLAAEAPRRGGLRQTGGAPKFKAPVAPRTSLLGLDKLAAEKRAQAAGVKLEPPSKRIKMEIDEDAGGVFKVPAIPIKRETARVKPEETPSHGGGLSEAARAKLEAYKRGRNMPASATTAAKPSRNDDDRGLGDFKSRLNKGSYHDRREDSRDRERYSRNDRDRDAGGKSWDAAPTPRTGRSDRGGDASMRVPNRGWDETPGRGGSGWGKSGGEGSRRGWDETPSRGSRGPSPEFQVDAKEWEEEQLRLDRDWYSHDDESAVVSRCGRLLCAFADIFQAGDDDHNPFSQWASLEQDKEAELQQKVAKRQTARQAQYVSTATVDLPLTR